MCRVARRGDFHLLAASLRNAVTNVVSFFVIRGVQVGLIVYCLGMLFVVVLVVCLSLVVPPMSAADIMLVARRRAAFEIPQRLLIGGSVPSDYAFFCNAARELVLDMRAHGPLVDVVFASDGCHLFYSDSFHHHLTY